MDSIMCLAAKNLHDGMNPEKLRFVDLMVQERNAKQSLRKWLNRGGEIVRRLKLPDHVNWVDLLQCELDTNNGGNTAQNTRATEVGGSRNLFYEMISNRNPMKIMTHFNSIDVNRDVYYDPQYALRQKKITDYFIGRVRYT